MGVRRAVARFHSLLERCGAELSSHAQLRIVTVAPDSSTPDVRRAFDRVAPASRFKTAMVADLAARKCAGRFGDPGEFSPAGNLGAAAPGEKLEWSHSVKS